MPLPDTIRVKLSSEAAEYISLTPVVVQEMPVRELVEHMLAITGKDETRIRDLLLRGALVSGASRFRWSGMDADAGSLQALLASFPDPDPSRPFAAARCMRAVLRGPRQPIGIPREIGMRRGFLDRIFGRASFWDLLMGIAASGDTLMASVLTFIRLRSMARMPSACAKHLAWCVTLPSKHRSATRR